jgi:hypothetical protein
MALAAIEPMRSVLAVSGDDQLMRAMFASGSAVTAQNALFRRE